jgi:hypothetical protein
MFGAQYLSLPLKGRYTPVKIGYRQWYCTVSGFRKLCSEVSEMEIFPFDTVLIQEPSTGNISYIMWISINGIQHEVKLTYDRDHPNFEMDAIVHWPDLRFGVMGHHYYGKNRPCYIKPWSRGYRAIHCAVQVVYWLDDYYKILDGRHTIPFNYSGMRPFPSLRGGRFFFDF